MQTMNERPTPETDAAWDDESINMLHHSRRLERERDEAREWQTFLSGWGGTPEIVHEFIKGQQTRIHAAQDAERERDEAREELDELNKRLIEVCQLGVTLLVEREDLRKEVAAERALADRLAQWMVDQRANWTDGMQTNPECGCDDCLYLRPLDELIAAWKEARK